MGDGAEMAAAKQTGEGWSALADGQWSEARAHFERALDADETPESLEGLGWSAWWLDDAEIVFDARERAYALYKQRGNDRAAGSVATWIAADQLDFRGAFAVASGWLQRAHRLLDPLPPAPEHGWLAFQEAYVAELGGETERAIELAREAAEIGRRSEVPDLEMLGLALEGAAHVECAEVERGMRCLDEATATALEGNATIPISSAWTCCFLVSACTSVLDYERAYEWCDRIAEFAERFGSRYMLAFCRAEYGTVHLWRGRWAEAESMLEASVEDFSRSRPAMAGGPMVALAELRRRQGRTDDALRLLEEAGASSGAAVCRARIALDGGDPRRAVELLEAHLRQLPRERRLDRAPALELVVHARAARGELEDAALALDELREVQEAVGTAPMRARLDLAAGVLAAAAGEHERARTLLEDALHCFLRTDAPFDAARARIELATTLLVLGRADVAEQSARAALESLRALGAGAEADRARRLLEAPQAGDGKGSLPDMTPREREVLALLAQGLTNKQIAEQLVVSEHTVHRHVTNILRKLDLPSRTAAAAHAVRAGLEPPAA